LASESGFRPHIEGLRGVAILLVVAFHVGVDRFFRRFGVSHLGGGYVGVDVFYVISGFLITGGLVRELTERGDVSLLGFYARRIRRLVPLGTLTILVTLAASVMLLPRIDWPNLARDAAAAAGFVANLVFGLQARSYLRAGADESPFLHYWSLSIEEQFYLLFPCVLLLAVRLLASSGLSPRRVVSGLLVLVIVLSFGASVWETWRGGPWGYYGLHSRMWELGIGGLLACERQRFAACSEGLARALSWLGLLAILVAFVAFDTSTAFPGVAALLPVLGSAALLVAGEAAPRAGVSRWLSSRPLVFIGGLSYAWYLLHWPFIVLAGPATWALERPPAPVLLGAAALSFLVAVVAQRWFEGPLRRSPALLRGRVPLYVLLGALASVSVTALALARLGGGSAGETARTARGAKRDSPHVESGCEHDFEGVETAPCHLGVASGGELVTILGDSHALQLAPALDAILKRHGLRGELYFKASCPPFEVRRFLKEYRREYFECAKWRSLVFTELAEQRPRAVILARYGGYASSLLDAEGRAIAPESAAEVWAAGVRRTLSRLQATGAPVFIVRDTPNPGVDIPRCVDLKGAPACSFSRAQKGRWDDVLFVPEAREAARFERVAIVDLTDAVCPSEACSVVQDGVIKFRDSNHLTATFTLSLAPTLELGLAKAL